MTDVAGRIHLALVGIRDHYDDSLQPVRRAPGSHVQTSHDAPLPISARILDVRAKCRSRLFKWCRVTLVGRDLHTEGVSIWDVNSMVEMLGRHVDWLGAQNATIEGTTAVKDLATSARDLTKIAVPERRDWMPLGPCPLVFEIEGSEDGDTFTVPVPCLGTIRAYPDCDPFCDACGTEGVIQWWERKMFGDLEQLLTEHELIEAIHRAGLGVVPGATIRKWASRGKISVADKDSAGRNLYHRVDVLYILSSKAAS